MDDRVTPPRSPCFGARFERLGAERRPIRSRDPAQDQVAGRKRVRLAERAQRNVLRRPLANTRNVDQRRTGVVGYAEIDRSSGDGGPERAQRGDSESRDAEAVEVSTCECSRSGKEMCQTVKSPRDSATESLDESRGE